MCNKNGRNSVLMCSKRATGRPSLDFQ